MEQDCGTIAGDRRETWHVASRFGLRLTILSAFALASSQPFWAVLTTLCVVAADMSVVVAVARRERALGPVLTHWDEAAFYAIFSRAIILAATTNAPQG